MLKNYTSGTAASTGKFAVIGGQWDATNGGTQSSTCQIFSFVNATGVTIRDNQLTNNGNGASKYGQFYGCSNVYINNVLGAGGLSVSRGSALQPCWSIDETTSGNISGLVAGDYASQMCSNVSLTSFTLTATASSDSSGPYSAYYALLGSMGSVSSNSLYHTNITVTNCTASGLSYAGVSGLNWKHVNFSNCSVNYPETFYNQAWVSSAPSDPDWHVTQLESEQIQVETGTLTSGGANVMTYYAAPNVFYKVRATVLVTGGSGNRLEISMSVPAGATGQASFIFYQNGNPSSVQTGGYGLNTGNQATEPLGSGVNTLYFDALIFPGSSTGGTMSFALGASTGTITLDMSMVEIMPIYTL
jgi:hypothetical protein